ncbi:hypothetical protein Tco_1090512 [Tanacetum coccineum]|uniref:Uncharacterized protein n=1 Tax=Tanacetum coccineum TaxID=301880 RepID=A0ABQ5I5M2_9ASTR
MTCLHSYITDDPTKVKIGERQRGEDEPKLLDTTVGRTVPLLPVAPARAQSKLDASVDRLFDEEGSGNEEEPHDSAGGDQSAGTLIVSEVAEVVGEDVIPLRSRQRKQKTIIDAGEPSHPAKKLRDDYGAPGGPFVAGVDPVLTLPFVTSFVSATPEREDEHLANSVTGLNLRTICAPQRFVISSDSSHHSGANIAEAEVDSIARSVAPIIATVVTMTADVATTTKEAPVKEAPAKPSLFAAGSSSAGGTDPAPGGFSDVFGSDFLVGGIRTVVDSEFDLQKVYVPQWSVTNRSCLDDGRVCREMLDEFAPLNFFTSICGMEHDQLFTEFNVGLLLKEAKAAEAIHLRAEASRFGVVEKSSVMSVKEQEAADSVALVIAVYDDKIKEVNDKLEKLDADVVAMVLHVEEKFYPHLLNTISGCRWLLTHGMELAIAKCLNSTEYLSALGAAIGKAVENACWKALSGLKSNKDASTETIMNLLRLEDHLADRLGLTASQPRANSLRFSDTSFSGSSSLRNIFIPLSEPLSVTDLTGTEGTSTIVVVPTGTTTALSITFASASVVRLISTDDYEVVQVDSQRGGGTEDQIGGNNVDPFPSVDDVDLNLQ